MKTEVTQNLLTYVWQNHEDLYPATSCVADTHTDHGRQHAEVERSTHPSGSMMQRDGLGLWVRNISAGASCLTRGAVTIPGGCNAPATLRPTLLLRGAWRGRTQGSRALPESPDHHL